MVEVQVKTKRVVLKVLLHLSLCAADREAHGGPEWVTFDPDYLAEQPADVIIGLEREARAAEGERVALLPLLLDPTNMEGIALKAKLILARRQAGCVDVWGKFQPRIAALRYRAEAVFEQPEAAGTDPLANGSAMSPTTPADAPSPTG